MSQQPANPCHLKKGEMIDSQKGFVDTFNWLVDFCKNLHGDKDRNPLGGVVSVNRSVSDFPVITADVKDGEGGGLSKVVGTDGSSASDVETLTFAVPSTDAGTSVTVAADAADAANAIATLTVKRGVKVVGTDGIYADCTTGKVTIESADDSNVTAVATADADGNVTIKVGVYYV